MHQFATWLRSWISYEYWDLGSLFLEHTIILERVQERNRELEECKERMMKLQTAECISEYNKKKDIARDEKLLLVKIESLIKS